MRIKTLEMIGFKSFVDRTVIDFEEGITGVVGPNGCGKSNLVDAIRWVMGEMSAKHLRGSTMEDVIFNGCESRPPMGMSQVFLTFDNSDGRAPADYAQYSEIQVGRRLYRSGESEYFINKTQCRLKDIVDLFLGTGVGTKAYSIVEQGMVGHIVHAKPEERRMLIEEAAGISKFKSRKEAALRRMESTRQNLARLADVLAELTRQINSLNRQAKKAERYRRISDELRGRELALAATRYLALRGEMESLSFENEKLRDAKAASAAELSGCEARLETARLSMADVEQKLDGVQQELYRAQHSIKLHEANIKHKTEESLSLAKYRQGYAAELSAARARLADVESRIGNANSQMVEADVKLAGQAEEVQAREAVVEEIGVRHGSLKEEGERLSRQVASDSEIIANLTAAVDHMERRRVDITGRIAKDQAEVDAIDRRRQRIDDDLSLHDKDLDGVKQLKLSLVQEAESAEETLDHLRAELAEAEGRFQKLRDEVSEKRSRLNSLKDLRKNLEGYRDGVRAVLSRTDSDGRKLGGVIGTVSEIIDTEPQYEAALGAVLGEKLQYVVVKSHEEGIESIEYLKQAARGRSSFIPMAVRIGPEAGGAPQGEGVVGPLMDFVSFDDDYKNIGKYLLGDVVLVEDLSRALRFWESGGHRKTLVTRDGCVVDPSGVVTGGAGAGIEEQLMAQKRRVADLEAEIAPISEDLARAGARAQRIRDRVKSAEEDVERLRRDTHGEELKLMGKKGDALRLREERARLDRERDELTVELARLAGELDKVDHERAEAKIRCENLVGDKGRAAADLTRAQRQAENLADEMKDRERDLIEFKVGLAKDEERASAVSREIVELVRTKAELLVAAGRRAADINSADIRAVVLDREVSMLRKDLDLAIRAVAGLQESRRDLSVRYEEEQMVLREQELSIRDIRKRHDEALARFHEVELHLTEMRGKVQYLVDGIRDRYRLDISSIGPEYQREDLDIEAEEIEVALLKERIEKIGPVNVDAIREFEELSGRHGFLTAQHADLAASIENLSKAIARINRTSRQRFQRAFEAVDEQFQMLFPKLFQGGKARLMLTDEENLLETGVEIVAQPPGKKLQSISLLSGGEKALTAVALVFSIFLIKPSPFCLLDEVDAPLDDANIDRFNDLIRSMTPHSQFILITHNKRTMEQADLLYGVTMEEAGVSKMVSVRLEGDAIESPAVA